MSRTAISRTKAKPESPAETAAEKLARTKRRKRPRRNESSREPLVRCRVREVRESLNLSLRDVAAAVGISIAGLHAIEHGNGCQMSSALKLAAFYGKSLDELWSEL